MRKIMFRGKRVKPVTLVSQWIYGNYVFKADNSLPGLSKHFIVVHDGFGVSQWIEVEPDTVGQYTGLKDKNGLRIFEGDLVEAVLPPSISQPSFVWSIMPVVFSDGVFGLQDQRGNVTPFKSFAPSVTFEVKGNVYDQPGL